MGGNIFAMRSPSGLPCNFCAIGFSGVAVVVPVVPVLEDVPVVADVVVVGAVAPPVALPDTLAVV